AQTLADYDYDQLSFEGVGLDYGFIWPDRVEPTPAYTLRVDLGFLGPGVRLVPSLTYWSSTLEAAEIQRFADQLNRLEALREQGVLVSGEDLGEIEWNAIALNVDTHVVWELPGRLFPYVGLGLGAHRMDGRGPAIDATFVEDLLDSVSAGAAAMAGLDFLATDWLRLYAEGRYAVLNDLRYPAVRVGAALQLPGGPE
ncbi:MAG: outer membrane protein, partial [Gemmatimonadota bacterium]